MGLEKTLSHKRYINVDCLRHNITVSFCYRDARNNLVASVTLADMSADRLQLIYSGVRWEATLSNASHDVTRLIHSGNMNGSFWKKELRFI